MAAARAERIEPIALLSDLDSTLIHGEPSRPYPEVVKSLKYITEKGKKCFLVSFSGIGVPCIYEAGISQFFTAVRSANSPTGSKRGYIWSIMQEHGLTKDQVVFADDLQENVDDITEYGIRCIHVDETKGLLYSQVVAAGF